MQKGLHGYDLSITKQEVESSEVTNNTVITLANPSIEGLNAKRYNPRQLKEKGGTRNEGVCSHYKNGRGGEMKNSLMIINALYKKGLNNIETISNIEKKYGRLDG